HYTGEPIGAAHFSCNWNKKRVKQFLPVYIHNFIYYDQNFIVYHLKYSKTWNVKALPINSQKFRTLTLGKIHFLDSLAMMNGSLDTLVNSLKKGNHDFPIVRNSPLNQSEEHLKLLIEGKGIFPYEWCDDYDKVKNATSFPHHKTFYSSLKLSNVTANDYLFGKKCFNFFKCKDMIEYMVIYCYLDVLLLAECVMQFKRKISEDFQLDMTNYISLPQLAFDCMLKETGCEIELMSDPEMLYMVESNIRGGLSYINTRYVNVENTNDSLVYVDANNLYSWAQSQKVPVSDYNWLSQQEIENIDWANVSDHEDIGYICMVDLHVPNYLHEKFNSFPPASESLNIFYQDLSPYSQDVLKLLEGEKAALRYHSTKLTGTLRDKTKYVCHSANLAYYLQLGYELKKVHRVIKFSQEAVIRPFISKMTKKRAAAKSEFDSKTCKDTCNSTFGKWMQDNRKNIDVKIVKNENIAKKYLGSPNYQSHRNLPGDLMAIFMKPTSVKMNRNYLVGFTILELSKLLMTKLYYSFIQPRLGKNNVSIVFQDTDSFILHCKNRSKNQVLKELEPILDLSNQPSESPLFSDVRKKIPGFLKDETPGDEIVEFVAPKSKCYTLRTKNGSSENKCKGLGKARTKRLTLEEYKRCVLTKTRIKAIMSSISAKNGCLRTLQLNKVCMTSFDDKRFLSCSRHSMPYGSSLIMSEICPFCSE
ncbi:MAG: hypothetical protein AAF617_11110, partial [Bacteroidota bacterium]